jgi:tetratricopeptide (TPR) repeat protein
MPHIAMMFAPQDRERDAEKEAAQRDREAAERDREAARREREASRRKSDDDAYYKRGMSYLDHRDFDRAIEAFNRVIESKSERSDGALYWRAYALNKLGKREDAQASIAELNKSYPQSRWIEDSRALQGEIRQASGHPVSASDASDEELKLLALAALMDSDPERTVPTLDKLLKSSVSPRVKERALFVLAQSRSPKARDLLGQAAKGAGNPDVQLKAIEYLGVNSSKENLQLLGEVYRSSKETNIKRAILRSFMIAHDREALVQAARNETNPDLRIEAIRQLGVMGGAAELYATETSFEGKRAIINGLMTSGDSAKLFELAKTEKDPKLRSEAINMLGVMGRNKTSDGLVAMYRQETDPGVKRSVINALFIQGNAPALIELARKETDPELKKRIVNQLAIMHTKESTDYMMELLNK